MNSQISALNPDSQHFGLLGPDPQNYSDQRGNLASWTWIYKNMQIKGAILASRA